MNQNSKTLPTIETSTYLIDTHCHLDMEVYSQDLDVLLDNAFCNGIKRVITIGIDIESSKQATKIAAKNPMVFATVGIHPHDVANIQKDDLEHISSIIDKNKSNIVGYGEIGLDYVKQYSPQDIQLRLFEDQISLAKNHKLPVIIHDREAHEDVLKILKNNGPFDYGGIMHCFSGNMDYAQKILDLGFHISIPGIVTFKNAKDIKDVAHRIPLNSMLLETDGPFLAPVPYRGKRNEPLYLLYTAAEIAKIRGITIGDIARATTKNAESLLNLPKGF